MVTALSSPVEQTEGKRIVFLTSRNSRATYSISEVTYNPAAVEYLNAL